MRKLRRIDAQPETLKSGRSALVRSAVETHLRAKERQEIDEAIGAAYGTAADGLLADVEDLLDAQAWPDK